MICQLFLYRFTMKKMKYIPKEIEYIAGVLGENDFSAFLVGGSVRDLLRGIPPKDFDIATNARPEEILQLFPQSKYENDFGTVLVKTDSTDPKLKMVEVTTFRIEDAYSDFRRPDSVHFAATIQEDLSRRDFTMNALALNLLSHESEIIDPYGGLLDLEKKILRAVGDPQKRFHEDALRLLRAVRFSAELGFTIEEATLAALKQNAKLLQAIAAERIRDEFMKIIMSVRAADGIRLLEEVGLLEFIIPELREGIHCTQNKHHIFTVFEHNVRALAYTVDKNYSLAVRLASLLHDVGKPKTKRGNGENATFHGHEVVGGRMTRVILERLRFSREIIERVTHLVRQHLFYYNVDEVTAAGVRRFLSRVGPENIDDLIQVREADRIGSGVPKAMPYKLRHLLFMIEKVKNDPIHPKMLAVKGNDVMTLLGIQPSPKVGQILLSLLEEVLDDPTLNTREYLEKRVQELGKLSHEELQALQKKARERAAAAEAEAEGVIKKKFHVT